MADQLALDRGYLNAIARGRKSGSEKKRAVIASHFNMTYEDMLSMGRRILESDDAELLLTDDKEKVGGAQNLPAGKELPASILSNAQKAIDVLKSDTDYSDLLAGMIDVLHDSVRIKKENQALRILNASLESRLTELEQQHREDTVSPCCLQDNDEPQSSSQKEDDQDKF